MVFNMTNYYSVEAYDYELPEQLIARYPTSERTQSRLLCVNYATKTWHDQFFYQLTNQLRAGDLLVFNDSRVMPARLKAKKTTGGHLEVLIERIVNPQIAWAQVKANRSPKPGTQIQIASHVMVEVGERQHGLVKLTLLASQDWITVLHTYGLMPIPPYFNREPDELDETRYQTVYAEQEGSVAAPTAGLHFDQDLLTQLQNQGVQLAFLTLHVGAGTFQPVRSQDIREHAMHAEVMRVPSSVCQVVNQAKLAGRRVIAVGTTVVRALESAAKHGRVEPYEGETDIFIYPGFQFQIIDALITNFHLPKSSLLMLVSAFAGYDTVFQAYKHAIVEGYRFFSYGDAMIIQ